MGQEDTDFKDWIYKLLQGFLEESSLNSLRDGSGEPAWDEALTGFASGGDPLWQQYKEYVGAFHWTPWEIYQQHHPEAPARPEELSVISWVLPQRRLVRRSNRPASEYPSPEWARIRVYGEECNHALRRHVAECLSGAGYPAIAPMQAPNWSRVTSQRFSFASTWSERHAARACGLGTFGLCDGLITKKGKAMRLGSVVARMPLEPSKRPYSDHRAYCLFFAQGNCGKCIERCPAGALSEAGHDKEVCRRHLLKSKKHIRQAYGFEGYGCGLCQVGVPCEAGIPVKEVELGEKDRHV